MGRLLFPMDSAQEYLSRYTQGVEREPDVLTWPSGEGISELRRTSGNWICADGLVIREIVTLSHFTARLNHVDSHGLAQLNRWATLGAFMPSGEWGPARLVSKVGIFDGDQRAAELLYAPLICTEAYVSGWHAANLLRGHFRGDPRDCPLLHVDGSPPLTQADFEAASDWTNEKGLISSLGDQSFTVEFPWAPGARSHMFNAAPLRDKARKDYHLSETELDRMGGLTSLLQLRVGDHPLYGSGVQCLLEIPVSPEGEQASELITQLNTWELAVPDLPPLFGSWCLGERAPAFVNFLPTQYCVPGILQSLLIWTEARATRVRMKLVESPEFH